MRHEPPHLRVVVNVVALVEKILAPGTAVRDEQCGRVCDARLRDQLHGILVQRHDRIAVLRSGIAVEHGGQIHLEVEPALERGHKPQLFGGHDDVLSRHPVAGDVLLDRLRAIVL